MHYEIIGWLLIKSLDEDGAGKLKDIKDRKRPFTICVDINGNQEYRQITEI